jgi:predicted RNA-binding protein YlxR (DUF448 family)
MPQRTCLACREVKDKNELTRLVRATDGSVDIDLSGRKMGRGAYLCRSRECWEIGLKGSRLEYALRTTISQANREQLIKYGRDLTGEQTSGQDRKTEQNSEG